MQNIFANLATLLTDLSGWIIGIIGTVVVVMVIIQIVGIVTTSDVAVVNEKKRNIFKILGFGVLATVITVVVPAIFAYFQ